MVDHEDFVQLLTPSGERVDHPDYSVSFTDSEYCALYRDLVLVRRLDAEATALQRQGELGLWASLLGQEAAQIGSGRALRPTDMAFPTYREHGVLWCRGVDPIHPLRLFRGIDQGSWDPHDANFHLYTIVIAAQLLPATGYAMGIAKDGKVGSDDGEAVIAYLGDGATSQGETHEALSWASVFSAPIVFFCQNNQYAISAPALRQTRFPINRRADGFGIPGIRVDGNDVLASYAVTHAALERARHGEGPTFIEAFTYRMGAHTTSDDPTRYRSAGEVEHWAERDPIARYRAFLVQQKLADDDFFASIEDEATAQAAELRARTVALLDPGTEAIFDHVYVEPSPQVTQQRDEFLAYQDGFVEASEGGAS